MNHKNNQNQLEQLQGSCCFQAGFLRYLCHCSSFKHCQQGMGPSTAGIEQCKGKTRLDQSQWLEHSLQAEMFYCLSLCCIVMCRVLAMQGMGPENANIKQWKGKAQLELLQGISGSFRPGVLTCLMGVSGAGKTTLMDVLAGRKTSKSPF